MKPISHKTLLRKSRNHRNEVEILKLAQIDSLKECQIEGETYQEPSPTPKYHKPIITEDSPGWLSFTKSILLDKARQLKP